MPSWRRVFYVDPESFEYLSSLLGTELSRYWDEIEAFDVEAELRKHRLGGFREYWALPKILTYFMCKNPSIYADIDTIALADPEKYLEDKTLCAFAEYNNDCPHVISGEFSSPEMRGRLHSFNAGFTWFSKPELAHELGHRVVRELHHQASRGIHSKGFRNELFMYAEEGCLGSLMDDYNSPFKFDVINEYCQHFLNKGTAVQDFWKSLIKNNRKFKLGLEK